MIWRHPKGLENQENELAGVLLQETGKRLDAVPRDNEAAPVGETGI